MLSSLAIIRPKTDPAPFPKKKTPKRKKMTAKVPAAYDDSTIEYSDFTPLPLEENVPDPAPLHDGLAFGAEEVDPEPDEIDEWQEMMKAAEDDANESDTESRTDVAQSSELEFEEDEFPGAEEPQSPWSQSHKKIPVIAKERNKVFVGAPLDFDDEFVP